MSEDKREQLSAMMDGELEASDAGIVDALLDSENLRSSWGRYHLIRDSLQQQLPSAVEHDLPGRLSESMKNEPHILAPTPSSKSGLLKPVAGFAIAASVATVAILGIQQNDNSGTTNTNIAVADNSFVNSQPVASTVDENQLRQVKNDARARMNSYLVNYSEYRTNAGLQGMLPYARTVTYEENK